MTWPRCSCGRKADYDVTARTDWVVVTGKFCAGCADELNKRLQPWYSSMSLLHVVTVEELQEAMTSHGP